MPDLTTEAQASFLSAQEDLKSALALSSAGSSDERETLTASAVVSAIEAHCYEVAALRDSHYAKLADIEGTLYNRLRG